MRIGSLHNNTVADTLTGTLLKAVHDDVKDALTLLIGVFHARCQWNQKEDVFIPFWSHGVV